MSRRKWFEEKKELAKVKYIAVGGGAICALNSLQENITNCEGGDFLAVDTDSYTLRYARTPLKMHMTEGIPLCENNVIQHLETQEEQAHSFCPSFKLWLRGANIYVLVACLGGLTASRYAPDLVRFIAEQDKCILCIVTRPSNTMHKISQRSFAPLHSIYGCADGIIIFPDAHYLGTSNYDDNKNLVEIYEEQDIAIINVVKTIRDVFSQNIYFHSLLDSREEIRQKIFGNPSTLQVALPSQDVVKFVPLFTRPAQHTQVSHKGYIPSYIGLAKDYSAYFSNCVVPMGESDTFFESTEQMSYCQPFRSLITT